MKKLVIIPGGFHPFHAGHKALYDTAVEAFPSADVFVAATADTSTRPVPFRMKKQLAQAAGIPANRFIQVKSPFRAEEITQMYDPNETQLIFVRSEKDTDSQPRAGGLRRDGTPAYLQPYKRTGLEPMKQHGYLAYLPVATFSGMTSATEIRGKWPGMTPEQKIKLISVLYPGTAERPGAAEKVRDMLDTVLTEADGFRDPEMLAARLRAKTHYGPYSSEDDKLAWDKWVQRSLRHSQEDSQRHDHEIEVLQQKVRELESELEDQLGEGWREDLAKVLIGGTIASAGAMGYDHVRPDTKPADQKQPTIAQKINFPKADRIGGASLTPESDMDEAVLINDPDSGVQLRPAGGMGTWDETAMVSNLARKFTEMLTMIKNGSYQDLYHHLYRTGVTENMIRALAELEAFRAKQGRRPIARGREIDITDYIDEK